MFDKMKQKFEMASLDKLNDDAKDRNNVAERFTEYLMEARKLKGLKLPYNKAMSIQIKFHSAQGRIIYYILQELGQLAEVKSEIVNIEEFEATTKFYDNIVQLNKSMKDLNDKIDEKQLRELLNVPAQNKS